VAATAADIELEFYEKFFLARDLEPYPVQEEAFNHIFAGRSVLVTVPTGTGKTMIAKAALFMALAQGKRAVYTTPLRALTEEKHRELVADFGEDNVGFATGDFKVNPTAPIQVVVAEILWNQVFSNRGTAPADVVVMDEGHYFNDFERGYVWEQSIIGLHPSTQLVVLSATVGQADDFCRWVERIRHIPMALVESSHRRIPLTHEYREEYLIEVVRELAAADGVPAIIFVFGREKCFETARLLKSCRRFTSDEERKEVERRCAETLLEGGVTKELKGLLTHGIGVHHAGILPRYKQLVEGLVLDRMVKFVVSTETISAGINLPAKRVVFPSLRKYIKRKARLVTPAEYHQMAGRAGRPQFDKEGVAIALGPEEIVQEVRKEVKDATKRGASFDEAKIRKAVYSRVLADARKREDVAYDEDAHQALVKGQPAALKSKTRITAGQVLAIGLPDLAENALPGALDDDDTSSEPDVPASLRLNISTVVDSLLLAPRDRREAQKRLAMVTANMQALGVLDEHGQQVAGEMIGDLRGVDGLFVYFVTMNCDLSDEDKCALTEYLVDHNAVHQVFVRRENLKRRDWIRARLSEKRRDNPQVSWEDIEAEYEEQFPRILSRPEMVHQEFASVLPHPELHGGKVQKAIWSQMIDEGTSFTDFVGNHDLAHEEGSLFSYLARVMKVAKTLHEATGMDAYATLQRSVRDCLAVVDERMAQEK